MRNKLQTAVATNQFYSSGDLNEFKLNSHIKKFQRGNLILVLAILLLFSSKGFAQINETFDTGIPGTWTLFGNGVGTSDWASNSDGYLGSNGVSVNPSTDNIGDQNTAQYFLVTPQLAVPENGEIQFYTKQTSDVDNGAEYEIRISTAAQPDINGFNITIQSYTEANLNIGSQTNYEKKVVELPPSIPAGLNIYVAFVAVNTQNGASPTGDEWFVDEVSILEGCIEVEDDVVTIESITVDSAEVTWSHPTATNFEIQILPSGGVPANSGIPVTGTTYTLMGLDDETEFDIYISAVCDNNTQSAFTGPYTFETLKYGLSCEEPIIVPDVTTTPYIFADNLANWANPDVTYTTQGSNCVPVTGNANYLFGDKVFFTYTPAQDGLVTLTQTTFDGGDQSNNCYNNRSSLFVYESCATVGVNCLAGTTTDEGFEPKSINNLLVQAGQTYIIVVSSEYGTGAGICFELEIFSPVCAPPADFTYNNLTENSVSFSWDNNGDFSDSWEYVVVPTGSGEPTGSGTPTNTSVDNLINTGLSPATTYDLYVRSICSGVADIWSNPFTFTTQCTSFNTPYFTDFNNATDENPEPCWTVIDANNDGETWDYINFGDGYPTLRTLITLNNNHDFYVSPRINLDGTPKRIRYKHRATQGVSTYTVKLSTTGVGLDDFSTVILPSTNISNSSFSEIIVDIPESITGEVNIAWIVEPNTTETALRFSIDDVHIEDKPTCPDPLNPFVLQITEDSAWLFWTEGDIETQWEVAIQDLDSGVPTGSGVLTSSNFPYMATGLDSGNRYEFYVRAYCADDDQSQWVGPVEFTTLCTSYDTPFYESFNDEDPDTQKFCWTITDANNDGATMIINETYATFQYSIFNPPLDFNEYLISPEINLVGEKELKFKVRADFSPFASGTSVGLEILMSTTNTNPSSFSVISPLEIYNNSSFEEQSMIIEGNGTVYIAFRVPPEFTEDWTNISIDDVSITDAPPCPNPSDLTVDTTTEDTADLSWSAGYQETAWNIVVQPAGSGLPTNNGTAVSTTNYSATGLSSDTEYEFYVMADCGTDGSDWIGPMTFRTLCSAFPSPFTETFNTDSTTEDCWQTVNNNEDVNFWELNSAVYTYEGDQAAAIFTATNGNSDDWLISPTITITDNQRLRFYYRATDSFFTEDLEVLLSTNGIGLDQFTTVLYDSENDPITINNEVYREKIINFPDGISGDINIAFHVPTVTPCPCGYRGLSLFIDNVNIEDRPECAEPSNITYTNIIDTEAEVTWDANGSETAWEISVQPSGTPAPVGDTDPSYLYNTTSNPFTITGLTASTSYDVYVRAICDTSESEWSGPEELLTNCSFDNLCEYTFVLTSDTGLSATLDITQNNQVSQSLLFTGLPDQEFPVFLCSGVEFSVYFSVGGSNQGQYENYQFDILNDLGETVYSSPYNIPIETTVYEGTATCGTISCPQPTDLSINETSTFSWMAGGNETQWEVAVQPIASGTIPQSGTIVSTSSYTPTTSDFNDPNAATYEYFVRAICGTGDESYWSGPFEFVRNDDVSTALTLPINLDYNCDISATEVSFIGATVSSETMSCDGLNGGDVWFDFTAESLIHIIEVNGFTGELYYASGNPPYPYVTMTLYKDNGGTLEEIACAYDKVLVAMYSTELVVGENYKLRLTLNNTEPNEYRFKVCLTTPTDLCYVETVNGGFEEPELEFLSGIPSFIVKQVVPGWTSNLTTWGEDGALFVWEGLVAPGFEPYEGSQCVQVLTDEGDPIYPPLDSDIKGLYKEFDSSEITLFDYSFAHLGRSTGNTLQLYAGPPGGPYTLINENQAIEQAWTVVSGQYQVPTGQDTTRFIFRASGGDDIGNVIDAVSITANNDIVLNSQDLEVDCNNPTTALSAEGTGTWSADDNNPSPLTFGDANSGQTTVSGFVLPGVYTITWGSRYCQSSVELTYNGIGDIPTVESTVEYCLNDTAEQLTATASGTYTLLWYTQAVGGTGSTTAPTPDTSIIGSTSYYVANVDTEGCEGPRAEIEVIVNASITPELTFSYDITCVVSSDNPMPALSNGFATGGMFTSATLTVDATTGEIDMATATDGLHDVTYTYDGDEDTCTVAGTYIATIEFTTAIIPVTGFNYGNNAVCILSTTNPLPSLDSGFSTGGEFTSATVTVDAVTGEIDLASITAGNHDVTYTVSENATTCTASGTYTTTIEITQSTMPTTDFSYSTDVYCADSMNVLPELTTGFTTGGVFSAESGLVINPTTGEIDVASSSLGNYNVTYEVMEDVVNCIDGRTSSYSITVLDAIEVVIDGECDDSDFVLTASPINGSYDPNEVTYTWMDANNNVVGQDSEEFNVTEYANQHQNIVVPAQFSVIVDFGGCSTTETFSTDRLSCQEIPRGISPDGDGKNDTFDLSGYGITSMQIFSRYGNEVFSFSGNYSNQWHGQSKKGDELPDGTYFYSITKEDGSTQTGWVFINRVH